jgi:hypothetical protein
MLDRV